MHKLLLLIAAVATVFALEPAIAAAPAKTIDIGGSRAVLIRPARPHASVILMPGGDGRINAGPRGTNHPTIQATISSCARASPMPRVGSRFWLSMPTSISPPPSTPCAASNRRSPSLPQAAARYAGRKVLRLPRTLVIHYRRDGCYVTWPDGVKPFIQWVQHRARVVWLNGGSNARNPCQARSHHGFVGLDAQVMSLAARFR